jgi:uncharacterized membrane protein YtjA (UPF0391 family)
MAGAGEKCGPGYRDCSKSLIAMEQIDISRVSIATEAEENVMLKWALIFFVISLIAGFFGFSGVSAASASIARILFGIALVIFVVFLVLALMAGNAVL